MKPFRPISAVEQLAAHLREEIRSGGLDGQMPGVAQLVRRLGVGTKTVVSAMESLKREGMLEAHGERKRNRIVAADAGTKAALRISILLYEEADRQTHYMVELLHAIQEAGHTAEFARKTLRGLGMDAKRVADFVSKTDADAWVIKSGSREVLEWFESYAKPAFAFFGRRRQVPLASTGPEKTQAYLEAVRRLAALGHRRIVMLVREERRKPKPGSLEQAFLSELEALGISSGPYNLPDWDENPASFHNCLDSLFKHTPPTAMFIDEVPLFFAAQHHLAQRGIVAPRHVSMICLDSDPGFAWFRPSISHIRWDPAPMVRRVVDWANNVARGKADRRKTQFKAEFVEGGTIGPLMP